MFVICSFNIPSPNLLNIRAKWQFFMLLSGLVGNLIPTELIKLSGYFETLYSDEKGSHIPPLLIGCDDVIKSRYCRFALEWK
jgi:hypothetical protein